MAMGSPEPINTLTALCRPVKGQVRTHARWRDCDDLPDFFFSRFIVLGQLLAEVKKKKKEHGGGV